METIQDAVLWVGLVIGSFMLLVVCLVYAFKQTFGVGGMLLTPFGVLLIGLSIWKTAEISVSPDGGLSMKLESLEKEVATLRQDTTEVKTGVSTLQTRVETVRTDAFREITQLKRSDLQLKSNMDETRALMLRQNPGMRQHIRPDVMRPQQ